jgi:hypothetical protein
MKNGASTDNTFDFFQETIEVLNKYEGPLTKETVLNAFLLAANEQSHRTQRAINRFIKQKNQAFLSKTKTIKPSTRDSELKMILKALGTALICSIAISAIIIFNPLLLPFITTYTSSLTAQYIVLTIAATLCLFAKGYFEHSQKKPLEVIFTNVDQTLENVPNNLKYLTDVATSAATLAATKTVSALTETIKQKVSPTAPANKINKNTEILTHFKKQSASSPSSRVLRSATRNKISFKR